MLIEFQIDRRNIRQTKFVDASLPTNLAADQLLLEIDSVAFTANNVTYAVAGEFLKYWQFFPAADAAWGKLPMWGYANVVDSAHPDVAVGERLYGYFPLANHLVVSAEQVKPSSLLDGVAHRQELNAIYNQYVRTQNVPDFEAIDPPDGEHLNSLLRPMFMTSFLIDDFVRDNDLFGARSLVLSSASSKTGYGTAFQLAQNRADRSDCEIIGLTSVGNVAFVESLGCYDRVIAYDDLSTLEQDAAVYVDFSGSGELRAAVHHHFGDLLKYDCAIGLTDWEKQASPKDLPGVKPIMFFAPAQAQKRQQEWGGGQFLQRVGMAMNEFVRFADQYVDVTVVTDADEMQAIYLGMVNGELGPEKGYIFQMKV